MRMQKLRVLETEQSRLERKAARLSANLTHTAVLLTVGLFFATIELISPNFDIYLLLPVIPCLFWVFLRIEGLYECQRSFKFTGK